MNRKYPLSDIKILYGLAAARCAFPTCHKELVLEETLTDQTKQIGHIAHIVAHSEKGPRADSAYPKEKLDTYENWILLCPNCHATVDTHENQYSTEMLRNLKTEHEQWVRNNLSEKISSVTFAELEVAINGILRQKHEEPLDFSVIPPEQKISQNQLSINSREMITMGLIHGNQVKSFLAKMEQVDDGFIDRLIGGFKAKYNELSANRELSSDAIFVELHRFSFGDTTDFKIMAAGLALLAHLFETCEVFER